MTKSLSRLIKLPLLASALAFAGASHAGTVLLSEGFDNDSSTLAAKGWILSNLSTPVGSTSWFEPGAGAVIPAYSGSSYLAANYTSGVEGGTVDDWLVSPTFSTAEAGVVTFYLTGAGEGYDDTLNFFFSSGSSSLSAFTLVSSTVAPDGWTAYSFSYAAAGADSVARFAVEYTGDWAALDYIGIDSFSVTTTPVPEPATWALFALGAAAAGVARRRAAR